MREITALIPASSTGIATTMIHDIPTSCWSAMKTPPIAMNGALTSSVALISTSIWTC